MILVFILCAIIILFITIIYISILSTIRISIKNLEISNISKCKQENDKINSKQIKDDYQVIFSLWLFNKVKWFQYKLNSKRMRRIYTKINLEKYDLKKLEQNIKLEDLKQLQKLHLKVSLFNLKAKLGTEDAVLTSFIIFFITTLIAITLPHVIKKYKKEKYEYEIIPVYVGRNIYEIKLNCIIEIKMVHIINMIDSLIKKRRVEKNERSSNRRSYGYSYE